MVEIHPELARSVLESLSVGVILIDRSECVSWLNDYAITTLKTVATAVLGRHISELPVPYTPLAGNGAELEARIEGSILGLTQRYTYAGGRGALLLLLDRDHVLWSAMHGIGAGSAPTSALGGLPRAALVGRLQAEVSRSRRYENPLSCIAVKIAGGGTTMELDDIARALKGQLRWVDLLGWWQPDVLLVILPETTAPAARGLRDKLAAVLAAVRIPGQFYCAVAAWQRGDHAEQLVNRALVAALSATG